MYFFSRIIIAAVNLLQSFCSNVFAFNYSNFLLCPTFFCVSFKVLSSHIFFSIQIFIAFHLVSICAKQSAAILLHCAQKYLIIFHLLLFVIYFLYTLYCQRTHTHTHTHLSAEGPTAVRLGFLLFYISLQTALLTSVARWSRGSTAPLQSFCYLRFYTLNRVY